MSRSPRNVAVRGGRRVTNAEVHRRLVRCEELLTEGHSRAAVLAAMAAEFAVKERTVDDYIRRVRESWVTESQESSVALRAQAIQRVDRLARMLEAKGAWNARVRLEELRCRLAGLEAAPERFPNHARHDTPMTLEEAELRGAAALQALAHTSSLQGVQLASGALGEVARSILAGHGGSDCQPGDGQAQPGEKQTAGASVADLFRHRDHRPKDP